jgi:hypothetical protein
MEKELTIDLSKETLDRALLGQEGITSIRFDKYSDRIKGLHVLNEFPQISHISMYGDESRKSFPFPQDLDGLEHVKSLKIWKNFDLDSVPKLLRLQTLFIAVIDPLEDVKKMVDLFPNLKSLKIWGDYLKDKTLAEEIAAFRSLEFLELHSCGISQLPITLKKLSHLKTLNLIWLPLVEFPIVVTEMVHLESLTIMAELSDLPEDLSNLKYLKSLSLESSLNDGFDFEYQERTFSTIPECIGRLENLEELNLNKCGVYDLSVLAPLRKLRKLELQNALLQDCEQLAPFTQLEELNLRANYKLENTEGLKGLPIKKLNLRDTHITSLDFILDMPNLETLNIDQCRNIKEYTPLYIHPKLGALEASNEILARWEKKDLYASLPSITVVIEQLQSPDITGVEEAIHWLSLHVEANYEDEANPLAGYFEVEPEVNAYIYTPMVTNLPILDDAIEKYLESFSDETLLIIFEMSFKTVGDDNFTATLLAIKEIIKRNSPETQVQLIALFQKACNNYDAGHRYCDNTVHDQLIDTFFAQFTSEALLGLLQNASTDMLNTEGGDAMDALFVPAFENTTDLDLHKELLNVFLNYRKKASSYMGNPYFEKLMEQIGMVANPELRQIIQEIAHDGKNQTDT